MTFRSGLNTVPLSMERHRKALLENRISFTLEQCELNFFETFAVSYSVPLLFNGFLLSSMLRGKKVMHLSGREAFDYLPGESLILPPGVPMHIDFPDADNLNPTQCLALEIENKLLRDILDDLNEHYPRPGRQEAWQLQYQPSHFRNDEIITQQINQLILACISDESNKDQRTREVLQALLLRVMQVHHLRQSVGDASGVSTQNALAHVIAYIKANIHEKLQIEDLSDRACMSRASFFRNFKREFGISPLTFIQHEKLNRAKFLLQYTDSRVVNISYELGFADVNYFIRFFKKSEGITPFQYRLHANQTATS